MSSDNRQIGSAILIILTVFILPAKVMADQGPDPFLVRSTDRPAPKIIEGTRCVARHTQVQNVWLYVPEELLEIKLGAWDNGSTWKRAGRTWMFWWRSDEEHGWRLAADSDQIQHEVVVGILIVAGVVILLMMVTGIVQISRKRAQERKEQEEHAARARKALAAKARAKLSAKADKLAKREEELQRQRDEFEAEQQEQEEKLRRARTSLSNTAGMLAKIPTEGGMKALAKHLRESYLFDQAIGEWISVVRVINPDLNGNVEFRWKLSEDMPRSTCVVIRRGGKVVKSDWGLEGELKQHIMPGKRTTFSFAVTDGGRSRGDPVTIEVKVPDVDIWSQQSTASDSSDFRERYRETLSKRLALAEMREEIIKEINAKDVPDHQREWMLGLVESTTATFETEI